MQKQLNTHINKQQQHQQQGWGGPHQMTTRSRT
jgi:hypothetical protein